MSVTFTAAAAEITYIAKPCDFRGCCEGDRCGYCEDGVEQERVSSAPELNVANGNARILISLLCLPQDDQSDLWGEIRMSELANYRRRITACRNRSYLLDEHARETSDTNLPGKCRVIVGGLTSQAILDRLERLDAVLAWAQEHRSDVTWG